MKPVPVHPRVNLLQYGWARRLLVGRGPLFAVRAVTLAGFLLTILSGLFGSRVGSANFSIIFVWIAWWTLLKLVFIPAGGRSWCSVCPLPMPGEWLQNGALLGPTGHKGFSLGRRWPRRLNNTWLQSGVFIGMGLFSAVILTQPRVTAWALAGLIVLSTVLALVFERRAFCRHICPIGGFTGQYAQLAPLEVRAINSNVCSAHTEKTCYTGSTQGYGCPWGNFPGALSQNTNCGLCMECLRSCPHDNMGVFLRPQAAETSLKSTARLDEIFLGLVMLGSAPVYSALYLGPWGWLKSAAYAVGSPAWFGYAAGLLLVTLVLAPGLFFGSVWLAKRLSASSEPLKKLAGRLNAALLPLGMTTWAAFTVNFAMAKFSYILPVLSDPFGWGWDLLGTAGVSFSLAGFSGGPLLQAGLLVGGLAWSARLSLKNAVKPVQSIPVMSLAFLYTLLMMWLLVG